MSKLQRLKAAKPIPVSKILRAKRELARTVREWNEFQDDIDLVFRYAATQRKADDHNVRAGVYAPRASPPLH